MWARYDRKASWSVSSLSKVGKRRDRILPGEKIGQKVIWEARKRGVIMRPLGDVIVLMPPLAIDEPTLERLVDVTYESIKAVTGI